MPKVTKTSEAREWSIGKLAKEAETSTATVHFYVAEGLLPAPRKINRTRAAYSAEHLRQLRLVRKMQAAGYSLAQIKRMIEAFGTSDDALTRMEGVGALQPLPPPKTDADQRPIELFDPIDRKAFLARAGCSEVVLEQLLAKGFVRPIEKERFDSRDLWQVKSIVSMLQDGIALEQLGVMEDLLKAARAAAPLLLKRMHRHAPALRTRDLRFRDLLEPLDVATAYFVNRVLAEEDPNWRKVITG